MGSNCRNKDKKKIIIINSLKIKPLHNFSKSADLHCINHLSYRQFLYVQALKTTQLSLNRSCYVLCEVQLCLPNITLVTSVKMLCEVTDRHESHGSKFCLCSPSCSSRRITCFLFFSCFCLKLLSIRASLNDTLSALLCSDKQSDLRRWHVVSCSARWDQDVPQPIRKYEQDYDGSLTSPFPWCNSSVSSKPIFMACFKNVFLLSWPSGGSRAKKAANVGISHPQIALASSIFVLWLGVSSFDQTSPLDILYLCFVDHFYWEQIISFSWKFVMGLRFFFS